MSDSENFETLSIPFDIHRLRDEFLNNTKNLPAVMVGPYFGGWSVTSSNGDYRDGFATQKPFIDANETTIEEVRQTLQEVGFKGPQFYRTPTSLCVGEIKKVIDYLNENDFYPCRARFTILKKGGSTPFHRDYPEWLYGVRLHIPIITNEFCFFEYENERQHLNADGSAYLLKINKTHRVENSGSEDRIHFLCDFFDTKQKTRFNKFTEEDRNKFKR